MNEHFLAFQNICVILRNCTFKMCISDEVGSPPSKSNHLLPFKRLFHIFHQKCLIEDYLIHRLPVEIVNNALWYEITGQRTRHSLGTLRNSLKFDKLVDQSKLKWSSTNFKDLKYCHLKCQRVTVKKVLTEKSSLPPMTPQGHVLGIQNTVYPYFGSTWFSNTDR